jgi:hypothetical protein
MMTTRFWVQSSSKLKISSDGFGVARSKESGHLRSMYIVNSNRLYEPSSVLVFFARKAANSFFELADGDSGVLRFFALSFLATEEAFPSLAGVLVVKAAAATFCAAADPFKPFFFLEAGFFSSEGVCFCFLAVAGFLGSSGSFFFCYEQQRRSMMRRLSRRI